MWQKSPVFWEKKNCLFSQQQPCHCFCNFQLQMKGPTWDSDAVPSNDCTQTVLCSGNQIFQLLGLHCSPVKQRTGTWYSTPSTALWMKSGLKDRSVKFQSAPLAWVCFWLCKAILFSRPPMTIILPVTILLFHRWWKECLQSMGRWLFKGSEGSLPWKPAENQALISSFEQRAEYKAGKLLGSHLQMLWF